MPPPPKREPAGLAAASGLLCDAEPNNPPEEVGAGLPNRPPAAGGVGVAPPNSEAPVAP